ncbi:hypothetical protein ACKLNR_005164 [Fusarium oxysporum f. sp. zingiberi]
MPAALCMPRLRYHQTSDDSTNLVTYKLTSAPVRTYVATEKLGGSFRTINSEHEGIQDDPCWMLGDYSMYHASQPGKFLGANNDDDYIKALEHSNVDHLMSAFGFFHHEYSPQTENGGVDLLALQKSICGDIIQPLGRTLKRVGLGLGLNPNDKVNNQNLLSLSVACNGITREFNLDDTFVARQRDPAAKTSYRMQCKSIPFTFNHIDISTPKIEETKWSAILDQHQSTAESMFANLFVVGNAFYSMNDQTEADRLMLVNNDNEKLKAFLEHHPEHEIFLKTKHKAKIDRLHESVVVVDHQIATAVENAQCSKDAGCSVGSTKGYTKAYGFSATANVKYASLGFTVTPSWSTGSSYTCNGSPGEKVCVWYKVANTAYIGRVPQVPVPLNDCDKHGKQILMAAPNQDNDGGGYVWEGQ